MTGIPERKKKVKQKSALKVRKALCMFSAHWQRCCLVTRVGWKTWAWSKSPTLQYDSTHLVTLLHYVEKKTLCMMLSFLINAVAVQ